MSVHKRAGYLDDTDTLIIMRYIIGHTMHLKPGHFVLQKLYKSARGSHQKYVTRCPFVETTHCSCRDKTYYR